MVNYLEKIKHMRRRQKESWLWGILIGVGVLLITIAILASIQIRDYGVYRNEKAGIALKYPLGWKIVPTPEGGIGGAVVAFTAPIEDEEDIFSENVNIVKQPLTGQQMTLRRYTEKVIKQITMTFEGYITVLESKSTFFASRPAHRLVYEGVVQARGHNPMKYLIIWVLEDDYAYVFTYTSQRNSYKIFLADVEQMIRSFKLI